MLKPIRPANLGDSAPSPGMVIKGAGFFVSSGHVGADSTGEPITSSFENQIVAMFDSLKDTLADAGLGFEHVARTTCYVREFSPEILDTIKLVRARYYEPTCQPASVVVQAGLFDPRLIAEMEVLAVLP